MICKSLGVLGGSKIFRVFVSSTFEDLVEERDVLQREVFPELQEFCLARGARFQAIDLRWGVSEQAAVDQRAISICLTEIARCRRTSPRPNFIVLLGDRYGWCPPPSEIAASEFKLIRDRVESVGDLEALAAWYPVDDNAVPPVHYLRAREAGLVDYEAWAPIERRLRRLVETAVVGTALEEDPRFVASATEQEIIAGALTIADAHEHVFCFIREIDGLPADGHAGGFVDIGPGGVPDAPGRERLERLKTRLRSMLPGNVFDYRAGWHEERPTYDHLVRLAADVKSALLRVISAELDVLEQTDPLEEEVRRHWQFGVERTGIFVGRDRSLAQIAGYLDSGSLRPLAIHGGSGAGKSALIAQAARNARGEHPGAVTALRFIGHTSAATSGRELLSGLCREVVRAYGSQPQYVGEDRRELLDEATLPSEYNDLVGEFARRLVLASPQRPLLMFLDALDQLPEADPARRLLWLPAELPDGVKIVVSTTGPRQREPSSPEHAPDEVYAALRSRLGAERLIALERMEQYEGAELLEAWLARAHRTLQPLQRQQVMDKFELEGLPLYLKLAFEQARLWRSDAPAELTQLAIGVRGVIRTNLFARLAAEEQHGGTLVARSLGYLAAAKNGLSEDELLDVLAADEAVMADFRRRSPKSPAVERLPAIVWSRLYFDLEPYLSERVADNASLLRFYHRQLREVVEEDYLAGDARLQRHRQLAGYFVDDRAQPLEREANGAVSANLRRLSELPYQQTMGELWEGIYNTLTDFRFLEVKAAGAGVMESFLSIPASVAALIESNTRRMGALPADKYVLRPTRTYAGVYQLTDDYALALERMAASQRGAPNGRHPIIVTGTDFGDGVKLRCPHCRRLSEFEDRWRGREIECPRCRRLLRINEFVVRSGAR